MTSRFTPADFKASIADALFSLMTSLMTSAPRYCPPRATMHHRTDFCRFSRLHTDGFHQARVARVHLLAVHLRLYAVTRRFRGIG